MVLSNAFSRPSPAITRTLQLTPHFKLGEFVRAVDPLPPTWIIDNLRLLANRLQAVRDFVHQPLIVTSGYRTAAQNQAVGGRPHSYHLIGLAADVVCPELPARALQQLLVHWSGGMGQYETFTHLDIRPTVARW